MDVVYPLAKGSKWDDTELRFSLRSLELFFPRATRVIVIGHKPAWLNDTVHHIHSDNRGENREMRIMHKIALACNLPDITREFLLMNDDHFFLKSFITLPFFSDTSLKEKVAYHSGQIYKKSVQNTLQWLTAKGLKTGHFDMHCPIVYDAAKFLEIYKLIDHGTAYGFIIKSLYCNYWKVQPEYAPDLKIDRRLPLDELRRLIRGRAFFSMGDGAVPAIGELLRQLYPFKSKWEI